MLVGLVGQVCNRFVGDIVISWCFLPIRGLYEVTELHWGGGSDALDFFSFSYVSHSIFNELLIVPWVVVQSAFCFQPVRKSERLVLVAFKWIWTSSFWYNCIEGLIFLTNCMPIWNKTETLLWFFLICLMAVSDTIEQKPSIL